MTTTGYILISNNGNHTGFNRKWDSDHIEYTYREAMQRIREIEASGELEELQFVRFVAIKFDRLPKRAYCIDDFDGGFRGYAPRWLVNLAEGREEWYDGNSEEEEE